MMLRPTRSLAVVIGIVLLTGCVTNQSKYSWGKYDQSLYDYYKHPDDAADYMFALHAAIEDASVERPVAPGIYAEYGYMLMQQENYDAAARYFEKEKAAWPESAQFMDRMIRTAHFDANPDAQGDEVW